LGLFAPLLTSFREQDIQSRFLSLDALQKSRRVVLLGLRRHDSLRLLSRLAHDAAFLDVSRPLARERPSEDESVESVKKVEKIEKRNAVTEWDERDWLFCGLTPPALPHVRIDAPDTLLRELEVLIAPSDGICESSAESAIDWNDLFAEWLPVIHLDLARVDSGLSDLARAPYSRALPNALRWVIASGQGALFNSRLSDLLTDVPHRANLFVWRRNFKARPEWFVYENYDVRYTDFMLWGRDSRDSALLLRKWVESGYDFRFPFSESRVRLALESARYRNRLRGRGGM
jgi:hypothetical protein